MMKVLMTTDTVGGVWTYTMDLIKSLERFNVHVCLATLGPLPDEDQLRNVRELPNVSLYSVPYKLEWMENPWDDLEKTQRWLLNLSFTLHPDIIHLNSFAFDCHLFSSPVVMVGHSCVLSWWKAVKNEQAPVAWNRYAHLVKKGLQSADMVVAPSRTMMKSLIGYYGPLPNTKVIYNAGDMVSFYFWQKEKYIFSMGRIWDEGKNTRILIEAAKSVNYPIFIAGDSKDQLKNMEIPSHVTLLGKLSRKQVAQWLSKATVYVLPSLYEPFGLSALEAGFSCCALLLSRIPSLQEIWKEHALYFNPRNANELALQINSLMEDDLLRKKMSRMALIRSSSFQSNKMGENYFDLYRSLLEKAKAARKPKKETVNHPLS